MTKLSNILLLLSCTFTLVAWSPVQDTTTIQPDPKPIRETDDYQRRDRDTDRDNVRVREDRSYERRRRVCEDIDKKNRKGCKEICSDIYQDRKDRKKCEKLSVDLIEDLEIVYRALEDGSDYGFSKIYNSYHHEVFYDYLNIGLSGLNDIIEDYSSREAKNFLLWLIKSENILDSFIKADDDYKVLITLFKSIRPSYDDAKDFFLWLTEAKNISSNIIIKEYGNYIVIATKSSYDEKEGTWEIFNEKINYSDTLMELVLKSNSDTIMKWFLDYINNTNTACDKNKESEECFKVYCKIGKELDEYAQDSWHEKFYDFQDYLDDIVSEAVNQDNWLPVNIATGGENADEVVVLDDVLNKQDDYYYRSWVDALCNGLTN